VACHEKRFEGSFSVAVQPSMGLSRRFRYSFWRRLVALAGNVREGVDILRSVTTKMICEDLVRDSRVVGERVRMECEGGCAVVTRDWIRQQPSATRVTSMHPLDGLLCAEH
jgi:hypothetical protein